MVSLQIACPNLLLKIVQRFFYQGTRQYNRQESFDATMISTVRRKSFQQDWRQQSIPSISINLAVKLNSNAFAGFFKIRLMNGIFPPSWKHQKLVLLPKDGNPPNEPSSRRAICPFYIVAKMLELALLYLESG